MITCRDVARHDHLQGVDPATIRAHDTKLDTLDERRLAATRHVTKLLHDEPGHGIELPIRPLETEELVELLDRRGSSHQVLTIGFLADVLIFFDVGGSMDPHIRVCEELFSAARAEFKHLEYFYFHNCVYDFMWKNNKRRYAEKFPTWDILRKYNKDYKLIFVGDATMSPYEILQRGGSVEYNNEETGAEWLQRLTHTFPKYAWINPEPQGVWQYRQSIAVIQQLMSNRMFPLTLKGLEDAMRMMSK